MCPVLFCVTAVRCCLCCAVLCQFAYTAVMFAAAGGHSAVVRLLAQAGADLDQQEQVRESRCVCDRMCLGVFCMPRYTTTSQCFCVSR